MEHSKFLKNCERGIEYSRPQRFDRCHSDGQTKCVIQTQGTLERQVWTDRETYQNHFYLT